MTFHLINSDAVEACLPVADCIDLMADTQIALSRGEIKLAMRTILPLDSGRGSFGVMPGEVPSLGIFGAKLISLFPANPSVGVPAITGAILLFDAQQGAPVALLDAASVTAIRTAAASGAATRILAREDASKLAVLGYGVQAESHLDAMTAVRPVTEVRVWGRSLHSAQSFAERQSRRRNIPVEPVEDLRSAIHWADLICTVTGSDKPIVDGHWLPKGCHLNCVGGHTATTREVDAATVRRSRVYVEVMEFALKEAGDLIIPLQTGDIAETHIIGEIGEVLAGEKPGRQSAEDITLYKSLGNAAQDIATATLVYQRAMERNLGLSITF